MCVRLRCLRVRGAAQRAPLRLKRFLFVLGKEAEERDNHRVEGRGAARVTPPD